MLAIGLIIGMIVIKYIWDITFSKDYAIEAFLNIFEDLARSGLAGDDDETKM